MGIIQYLSEPTLFLLLCVSLIFSLTFHEYAHGIVAYYYGDDTAYKKGRLTLNPLAHLDPMGTLMILFIGIGYAKPVPVNPQNLSNPRNDIIYKGINVDAIPNTESLKDTYDRVIPYFNINIRPKILAGKNVIIAAHGNSLRALCKLLFNISNENINKLEIPTGNPLLVKLDSDLKFISAYYLDETRAQTIIQNK